jgi:hypothetical protein
MKRRALAVCAGMLLLGLLPGPALANVPSNLDQSNNPSGVISVSLPSGPPTTVAQTFTAGKSGLLSGVDLYLRMDPAGTVNLSIEGTTSGGLPDGTDKVTSSASVPVTDGWIHFSFWSPLSVTAGTLYAIVFSGVSTVAYASLDTYPGGQGLLLSGSWTPFSSPAIDFAFRTYVDTVTVDLQWDKPQITAGASTPLTLTATMNFFNGVEASSYFAVVGDLPSWYTVTGVTCPAQISPADCTAANLESGFRLSTFGTGATLTFTLVGTASPDAAAAGTSGSADGAGCLGYEVAEDVRPNAPTAAGCANGSASVQVVAAEASPTPFQSIQGATAVPSVAATPPPTSTGVGPASDDPGNTIWFLPIALVALFGGLLFLVSRQRRRIL